jgi:hypothetical protein
MSRHLKWFNWVTQIGVLINILGMALPFIFSPQWYLDFFGLPGGGGSHIWMRQAGLLLFLVSLLYAPGGWDPARYRINAWFAILGRTTIGLYWFYLVYVEQLTRSYLNFAYLDCCYAAFNAIFLWKVLQGSASTPALGMRPYEVKSSTAQ